MLKQNFPSQTCREWFIKLCAWGPDFAARNEYPAIESNIYRLGSNLDENICLILLSQIIMRLFYKINSGSVAF